jgi:hypothetical protein
MKSSLSLYAIVALTVSVGSSAGAQRGMAMGGPEHAAHEAMAGR